MADEIDEISNGLDKVIVSLSEIDCTTPQSLSQKIYNLDRISVDLGNRKIENAGANSSVRGMMSIKMDDSTSVRGYFTENKDINISKIINSCVDKFAKDKNAKLINTIKKIVDKEAENGTLLVSNEKQRSLGGVNEEKVSVSENQESVSSKISFADLFKRNHYINLKQMLIISQSLTVFLLFQVRWLTKERKIHLQ